VAGPNAVFLVEHYVADVSPVSLDALARRLSAAAAELCDRGLEVGLLGVAGLPGDEAFLHLVSAPSEDVAERLCERAGLTADRVVPALWRPRAPRLSDGCDGTSGAAATVTSPVAQSSPVTWLVTVTLGGVPP
jgi:hypothetical protein